MWNYLIDAQKEAQAAGSFEPTMATQQVSRAAAEDGSARATGWFDPSKLDAALAATPTGKDGRKILTGDALLSVINPKAAPKQISAASAGGWAPAGADYKLTGNPDTERLVSNDPNSPAQYEVYTPPSYGEFLSENGQILRGVDGAQYGDPGGIYYADKYDNPTGNGKKDQANVVYKVDGGKAVPVSANNTYNPSGWVDGGRFAAEWAAILGTAGAAGTYLAGASAAAGTGVAGGSAATGNMALIDSGLGTAGYGGSSAGTLAAGNVAAGTTAAGGTAAGLSDAAAASGASTTAAAPGTAGIAQLPTVTTTFAVPATATPAAGITLGDAAAATAAAGGLASAATPANSSPDYSHEGNNPTDRANMDGGTGTVPTVNVNDPSLIDLAKKAGQTVSDFIKTPAGLKALGLGIGAIASASGSGGIDASSQTGLATGLAQMGQNQIAFNQKVYNDGQPTRDAATQAALQTQLAQMETAKTSAATAADLDAYNKTTFRPLQQKIVADAMNYDTAGRRADAVAAARADTESAYDSSINDMNQSLGRAGIAPGSGRAMALMGDAAYAKAGSIAGATAGAVRNVENTANTRQLAAAALGANLPAQQNAALATGITAGNSAVNSGSTAIANQSAGLPQMNVGFAGGTNATLGAGTLYNNAAKMTAADDAATSALWGQIGAAAGQYFASDEDAKDNTKTSANGDAALDQIDQLDVREGWHYKADPNKTKRVGPMAQNVRATMGDDVAPGGKVIDAVSMNGKILASMQALSSKVKKLERRAA